MLFKVTEIGYSKWTKCLTLYPRLSFIPFDWTVKEIVKKCLYRPCFSSVALYVVGPFCFPSHRQSKMSLLYVSKRVWNDTKRKMIDLLCSMLQTLNLNLDDHLAISEQKNKGRLIRTLNGEFLNFLSNEDSEYEVNPSESSPSNFSWNLFAKISRVANPSRSWLIDPRDRTRRCNSWATDDQSNGIGALSGLN